MKTICLKSTGAIGDLVLASALLPSLANAGYGTAIISKGFTLPLLDGLEEKPQIFENESQLPDSISLVDISDYLSGMPYSKQLPADYMPERRMGHLCEWMGYSVYAKSGIYLLPKSENVKVALTKGEVEFGKQKAHEISKANNNKPIVIIAPYSTVKNKNLPKSTLEQVIKGISDYAVPCLLEPYQNYLQGTTPIGDKDLRNASAILYACDAYLGVDSGPLHIINGTINGTPKAYAEGINTSRGKIIAAIGSSHKDAVTYKGNIVIQANSRCSIAPCGAHGYWPLEAYEKKFNAAFHTSGIDKDKSGCSFADYSSVETARCMQAIEPEELISAIKSIVT